MSEKLGFENKLTFSSNRNRRYPSAAILPRISMVYLKFFLVDVFMDLEV